MDIQRDASAGPEDLAHTPSPSPASAEQMAQMRAKRRAELQERNRRRTRSRTLSTSYRAQDGISIMKRRVSERESICDPIWDVVGEEEQLIPEEDSTCWSLTNPNALAFQLVALFFMCMMGFGTYIDFEIPSALIGQFYSTMKITDVQYSLMYSLAAWSNLGMSIVGGYLIDKVFGPRIASVVFCLFCVVGQCLLALGAFLDHFQIMQLARFVYGIGDMPICIVQNIYTAAWFKGRALNLAAGLQLSISRVGSTTTFQIAPAVYNTTQEWQGDNDPTGHKTLGWTLLIMSFSTIMSMIGVFVSSCLDGRRNKWVLEHASPDQFNEREEQARVNSQQKNIFKKLISGWVFPISYWLLTLVCVSFYATVFPFVEFGKDLYMNHFQAAESEANFVNGLIYLISAFATPTSGFIIDRIGFNIFFIWLGCTCTILGHAMVLLTLNYAMSTTLGSYLGTIFIGFGYSITVSSMWPLVALIVPEHKQGTAYGLMHGIQSSGLAITPIIYGAIKTAAGWKGIQYFNLASLAICAVASVGLYLGSKVQHNNYLNMSNGTRIKFEKSDEYTAMMQRAYGNLHQPLVEEDAS